jgi:hypothetical protein
MNTVKEEPRIDESQPGNSQEDGDDIGEIEGYGRQGENRVRRNRTRKIQKARKDANESGRPDGTDGGPGEIVHHCEVTAIGETPIAAEGVHRPGTSLKGSLDDEESGETDESPQEEGSGFSDSRGHDLVFPSE